MRPLGDHPAVIHAISLSKDGRTLFVGGDAGTERRSSIVLIDTESRQIRERIPFPVRTSTGMQLKPLPDGHSLAVELSETGLT